jgi:hypothetical protein
VVRCNEGEDDLGELVVEVEVFGVGRNLSLSSDKNPRVIGGRRFDSCFLDRVGRGTVEDEADALDDSPNLG